MTEGRLKYVVAGIAGLIAFIVYCLTMAPTVSFWDCGEFVAAANTMGVPHPPGVPLFMMLGRVAILFLPFVGEIAKRVNYVSVLASSMGVFLVALINWEVMVKMLAAGKDKLPNVFSRRFVLVVSSLVSAFLLTFSDTFWFNAVEAEMYSIGMACLLLMTFLAIKWVDYRNTTMGDKLILLIGYLGFVGIGVILYSMLAIPLIMVLLVAYSEPGKRLVRWPLYVSGVILYSVVYSVSNFLPWSVTLFVVLGIGQFFLSGELRKQVNLSFRLVFLALLGYSIYFYIPIRSSLNPTIDENHPTVSMHDEQGHLKISKLLDTQNWTAFNDYIERKQYGSESMLSRALFRRGQLSHQIFGFANMGFGGYQISQYFPWKQGQVNYYESGLYTIDPEDNPPLKRLGMKFPTLLTAIGDNTAAYAFIFIIINGLLFMTVLALWKRNKAIATFVGLLFACSAYGLTFYLNFADGTRPEHQEYEQWKSTMEHESGMLAERGVQLPTLPDGVHLMDVRLAMSKAPSEEARRAIAQDPDWQSWERIQGAYKTAGYQVPDLPQAVHLEVRERDYFWAPGWVFMALLFGLGAGMLLLYLNANRLNLFFPIGGTLLAVAFIIPCFSNWTEHNRSGNWVPWDYAYNLLQSCLPNSVLFTNGDNDTFPLWFAQEVEGIRPDVRVVNLSLGNTDWYIKQIKSNAPTMKLSYTDSEIDRSMVFSEDNMRDPSHQVEWWTTKAHSALPILQKQITELQGSVDSATNEGDRAIAKERLQSRKGLYQIYDALVTWGDSRKGGFMKTQDKLVLDLALNNPDRPLHFANTVGTSNFVGLEKYMIQEGMVYTLKRGDLTPRTDEIDLKRTMFLVDSVYKYRGIGDGTTFINLETERLLFNYNTLYIRLALEARTNVVKLAQQKMMLGAMKDSAQNLPATATPSPVLEQQLTQAVNNGIKYCDLGIHQFPTEWRNYAVAAELLETAGLHDQALAYLQKGKARLQGRSADELNRRIEYFKTGKAN